MNPPERLPAKAGSKPCGARRRRSKRIFLTVPVEVFAEQEGRELLRESTSMLSVNANGGLLVLAAEVREGQRLQLVNIRTREEQECRVVSIGSRDKGQWAVGVEFTEPANNFWRISFPPLAPRLAVQTSNEPATVGS